MSAIHETAYPRLKSAYSEQELKEIYTPPPDELAFVCRKRREAPARFALFLLLKTCQRLGFFLRLADIPAQIRDHIAAAPADGMRSKESRRNRPISPTLPIFRCFIGGFRQNPGQPSLIAVPLLVCLKFAAARLNVLTQWVRLIETPG